MLPLAHPGQMLEHINHLLLLERRLELFLRVPEHPQAEVALAHAELPEPVLVLAGLEGLYT